MNRYILKRLVIPSQNIRYSNNYSFRNFGTYSSGLIRNHNDLKFFPKEEYAGFIAYLPKIIDDATHKNTILDFPPINKRLRKLLEYVAPTGKQLRIHLLLYTYKFIEDHYREFRSENMEEPYKLAWCLEMFNTQFLIFDDFLDNHLYRRGKKSWYNLEGKKTLTDSYLLQFSTHALLKKYFFNHENYTKILENFIRIEVAAGLALELESNSLQDFTMDRMNMIGHGKGKYFLFNQPIELASLLSNKALYLNEMLEGVFVPLTRLYVLQNDVLDCYGAKLTGKPGTDIQQNRCTCLIAIALEKASTSQRKILEECYGSYDEEKVEKVLKVYEELNILEECHKREKMLLGKTVDEIEKISDPLARSFIERIAFIYTFGDVGVAPY